MTEISKDGCAKQRHHRVSGKQQMTKWIKGNTRAKGRREPPEVFGPNNHLRHSAGSRCKSKPEEGTTERQETCLGGRDRKNSSLVYWGRRRQQGLKNVTLQPFLTKLSGMVRSKNCHDGY